VTSSGGGSSYTYYETEFSCYFIDVSNNPFGMTNSEGSNMTSGITGINEGNSTWIDIQYLVDGGQHGKAIDNLKEYLKCLDGKKAGQVTIFVDQPVASSNATHTTTNDLTNPMDVGHVWISITQEVNATTITRLIGFYPSGVVMPGHTESSGQIKDDSGRSYDVSLTIDFTASQIQGLLDYINNTTTKYDLDKFNCTNFVVDAFGNIANFPRTLGTWPGGGGLNPGNFGEDIRNYSGSYSSKNMAGGVSQEVRGACN
jgi:hypothetical protein